jgi:hypothetical protein
MEDDVNCSIPSFSTVLEEQGEGGLNWGLISGPPEVTIVLQLARVSI